MSEPIDRRPSRDEVVAETARVLEDALRYVASTGESYSRAFSRASIDAGKRDMKRELTAEPLGNVATMFAVWASSRSRLASPVAAATAALHALGSERSASPLAHDVHAFIGEYVAATISDEEFVRRLKKPLQGLPRVRPARDDSGDFVYSDAERRLTEMLATASVDPVRDPLAAWATFASFARQNAAPDDDYLIESDDFLVEQAADDGGLVLVDLVRQFTLQDRDGDYDEMRQLHLSLWFEPGTEENVVASEVIWSGANLDEWLDEVAQSDAYQRLATGPAIRAAMFFEAV